MSDKRLIDAEELKATLKQWFPPFTLEGLEAKTLFKLIIHDIDNAPTVAVNCNDCDGYEAGYSAGLKDAERPQGDLISRSEAEKLGATCLAKRNENGQLEAIISLDNAPTVCGNNPKWCESCVSKGKCASTRPQGEWKNVGFMVCECNNCKEQFHELEANNYCPNFATRRTARRPRG